jgi:hypothetical protein
MLNRLPHIVDPLHCLVGQWSRLQPFHRLLKLPQTAGTHNYTIPLLGLQQRAV